MSVKDLRVARGLTRREVARALGMTEQSIYNIETGRFVSKESLINMADFYGVTTDFILGRPTPEGGDDA